MNIKIDRSNLLPILVLVSSVVEKRQTLPILANLYFGVKDRRLTLVGTDLEVEISVSIDDVDADEVKFTVSTRKVLDICRMLPESATINLKTDGEKIIVSSGRSRYTLKSLPAGEFPRIETGNWEERFKISQISLKKLLEKTAFAMALQDVRYYLNGILFEIGDKCLRAIATDGHRLAQSEVEIALDSDDIRQLIVPRKAIAEIMRFLDGDEESEVLLEMSKNHLRLSKENTNLITKLIDGKFPEFKGILETELNIVVTVDSHELIDTMTRAAVLATDRFRGVKLMLSEGTMSITASNPEQEEALEELAISYTGEVIKTGYNVSYLIDAARAINHENVELHFHGNDGICILKQPEEPESTWLVMPMRV